MRERPIIFNAEMVRAVLEGRKTQTRRVIEPSMRTADTQFELHQQPDGSWMPMHTFNEGSFDKTGSERPIKCPFGAVGDRLWVRETFGFEIRSVGGAPHEQLVYRASKPDAVRLFDCNGKPHPMKWTPSLHMRRKYSRITLEITGVRVERLQDISEADCAAEGLGSPFLRDYKKPKFAALWQSIYGGESWQANPWVWVIEFKRVESGK